VATLCQMNALKSLPNPTPVRSLVVSLLYAFYDRDAQTAKKKQEIKTELQICVEQRATNNTTSIGPANSAKVQNRIVFFCERSNERTLFGPRLHTATLNCTRRLAACTGVRGCGWLAFGIRPVRIALDEPRKVLQSKMFLFTLVVEPR
jgi:hypothetical protein